MRVLTGVAITNEASILGLERTFSKLRRSIILTNWVDSEGKLVQNQDLGLLQCNGD